jgi:signal transduction histidine kinase
MSQPIVTLSIGEGYDCARYLSSKSHTAPVLIFGAFTAHTAAMSPYDAARACLAEQLAVEALSVEEPAALWPLLARRLSAHFGCERVTLFQTSVDGTLMSRYADGLSRPVQLPEGGGIAGAAVRGARPVVSNAPYADARFERRVDGRTRFRTESVVACPLRYRGKVVGVVELINKPGGFAAEDVEELERLASQISVLFVKFRYEEEQAELTRHLVQAEKMSAVGRLASGLAHEINNPLTAIMGYISILLRLPGMPDKALEMLLKVDAEVRRVAAIVRNMLGFARPATADEPVDLRKVVEDCAAFAGPELRRRGIALEPDLPATLPLAQGSAGELKQVFLNLVLNASQALLGRDGGRVAIRLRASSDGRWIVAEVADNGPGVPTGIREKIFEPFFTTKGESGTGLGLYVSAGIVQRHKGRLLLRDAPGGGALFSVELPASA